MTFKDIAMIIVSIIIFVICVVFMYLYQHLFYGFSSLDSLLPIKILKHLF